MLLVVSPVVIPRRGPKRMPQLPSFRLRRMLRFGFAAIGLLVRCLLSTQVYCFSPSRDPQAIASSRFMQSNEVVDLDDAFDSYCLFYVFHPAV